MRPLLSEPDPAPGVSASLLEALFDTSPIGIYVVDAELRIQLVNRVARPVFGDTGELIGRDFAEVMHILWHEPFASEVVERFRHTLKTGAPYATHQRTEWRRDRGAIEYYEWSIHRIVMQHERYAIVCYFNDIADRVRAKESLAHLAAIVASSDDAIMSKNLDGVFLTWNAGAERIFGYTAEEAVGRPATLLMPPDRINEEPGILERIKLGEGVSHYDTVRQRKDGTLVDISLTVSPLRDENGRITGATKIARDISERKKAEAHQRLLSHELQHRTKNMLAVIQSIARRTFTSGSSIDKAQHVFIGRLTALGNANDLLANTDWQGAILKDIVERSLAPFATRYQAQGCRLLLNPNATQAFTLVTHELSTNALKHGAFSKPSGTVSVHWNVDVINDQSHLIFRWEEMGGPIVEQPKQTSFGTQLLNAAVAGAETRFDFDSRGLIYTLTVPISAIIATAQDAKR